MFLSHEIQCGPIHWPELLYFDLHTRMWHGTLFSSPFISQSGQGWHMHHSSSKQPLFVHKSPSTPLYLHGHSNMADVPFIVQFAASKYSASHVRPVHEEALELETLATLLSARVAALQCHPDCRGRCLARTRTARVLPSHPRGSSPSLWGGRRTDPIFLISSRPAGLPERRVGGGVCLKMFV